jgi:hypothetical protein
MLDQVEQEARIEQMMAETRKMMMETNLLIEEAAKRRQDIRFAPLILVFTGMGTATALIGAGAALAVALHNWA